MYNLLVSAYEDAWENGEYSYDYSRYLEYTNKDLINKFKILQDENIEIIKEIPAIFAYETGLDKPPSFGKITSVKTEKNSIVIKYEKDDSVTLPLNILEENKVKLGIDTYEMMRTHWAIKDINIKEFISEYRTKNYSQIENFKFVSDLSEAFDRFNNITNSSLLYTVDSFSSFYETINKIVRKNFNQSYEFFYRGHGDYNYELVPTLFRTDKYGNPLYRDKEELLIKDTITDNPGDFLEEKTTIEKLMKMQHYSLPTRLLDITSNPLVALYFACSSEKEEVGEVIIFKIRKSQIKYYDSDTVACISNLAMLNQKERDKIDRVINESETNISNIEFNEMREVKRLIHFIKGDKPYFQPIIESSDLKKILCVKSKKNNSRIVSQSGNFLLYGLGSLINENYMKDIKIYRIRIDKKNKDNNEIKKEKECKENEKDKICKEIKENRIKMKNDILKELDLLDINLRTIYPGIESSSKYLSEKHKYDSSLNSIIVRLMDNSDDLK